MFTKIKMWFDFLLKFQPTSDQHAQCMESEEGYAEAWQALMLLSED